MRRALLFGIAALLVAAAAACGEGSVDGPASGAPGPAEHERAQILSAVLRRYLTTPAESSFGQPFENIHVLSRTDGRDGQPMGSPGGVGTVIPAADQQEIARALRDLGEVTFVDSEDDVIETIDGCAQVRDGGILMTLGDPVGDALRVEVALSGFVACLGATWLTYVVQRDVSGWRVTGTTGSIAVA